MSLQIRRLSYALGAEILGVDISKPIDDRIFGQIHAAFLEHGILLFRGQPITPAQHVAFSRRFGEIDRNDTVRIEDYPDFYYPEYPEIVINKPKPNTKPSDYEGNHWHTDQVHRSSPPMASLLHSIEVPEVGGDTMFSNMYLAYETLSDGMKKLIEGLYGIHTTGGSRETKRPKPMAHPIVRVHPETGRKSLFVTERVKQFVGMSADESRSLLQFLCRHGARPQFVYRHQWRKHDLLMWDNRCMWHYALGDYDGTQIRHMERIIVMGTPSGGFVYEGPLQ